jgi:hypothetical protein
MSTGETTRTSTEVPEVGTIDMALEVVTVPVSDIDLAKRFYRAWDGGWTSTWPPATTSGLLR